MTTLSPTQSPTNEIKEKFRRILEAERARGFDNSAVIGGLDRFLERLKGQLAQEPPSPEVVSLLSLLNSASAYGALSSAQRKTWIEGVIVALSGQEVAPQGAARRDKGRAARSEAKAPAVSQGKRQAGEGLLEADIRYLPGVGEQRAAKLRRLGLRTGRDLLYHIPRNLSHYLDLSQIDTVAGLRDGASATLIVNVWEAREWRPRSGRMGTEAFVGDDSGNLRVIWFNMPYIARQLEVGEKILLHGEVSSYAGMITMVNPEKEVLKEGQSRRAGRIEPLYPLTEGLQQWELRRLTMNLLPALLAEVADPLPAALRQHYDLPPLQNALREAHWPPSLLAAEVARRRLVFDELLQLQLGLIQRRKKWEEKPGPAIEIDRRALRAFIATLPFALTEGQRVAMEEILGDMARPHAMLRLLQGEVGSGKTVVAAVAVLAAAAGGYQSAVMAPTEILAEQHFRSLEALFSHPRGSHLRCALLTGSVTGAEREAVSAAVEGGKIDLLVGTHALIQEKVSFSRLGLVIVDEQHRFGVLQRVALRLKGHNPHVLVMTATPIPRTLALTVFSDLDISTIPELPPGRMEIETRWLRPEQRGRAYDFVRQQVRDGRQAFIVCPLVEESEKLEAKAALVEFERLRREVFPDLRLGLLHGRLKAAEKEETMRRFRDGAFDVLICTPVVEVGIDVPNATVMLIEGADRFGLAQLHQFRGRVGRGAHRSSCLLLADSVSHEAAERLATVARTRDGFVLAQKDLELRGPGDLLGTRQSGLPELRVASVGDIISPTGEATRGAATSILDGDPSLSRPEHRLLAKEMARLWERVKYDASKLDTA